MILGPKHGLKKVEIEGVRPIWRDPQRNSASNPASDVQNGEMATHLVKKCPTLGRTGFWAWLAHPRAPYGDIFQDSKKAIWADGKITTKPPDSYADTAGC